MEDVTHVFDHEKPIQFGLKISINSFRIKRLFNTLSKPANVGKQLFVISITGIVTFR